MKKFYKKRGQGFTLIELLAVLVVLAILVLIAIPVITNVFNKARKQSYQRSIESYVRATELAISEWQIENPNGTAPTTLSSYTIETKGDQVTCNQEIEKSSNGGIKLTGCYTEKSIKKYPDLKYKYVEGKVVIDEYQEYKVGDIVLFNNEIYNVIIDSNKKENYVVMLKYEPLTSDQFNELGLTFTSIINGYATVYYDTNNSTEYETSNAKKKVDKWFENLPEGVNEARLITIDELRNLENSKDKINWMYGNNYIYWTMSPHGSGYLKCVGTTISYCDFYASGRVVIRPVINVLKSAITKN